MRLLVAMMVVALAGCASEPRIVTDEIALFGPAAEASGGALKMAK